jgi:Pentapeptide repeats (8 copies)
VREEKSLGWRVANCEALIKTPPEWLASAVYVVAALLLAYVLYMIVLGLIAFTALGNQIVSNTAIGALPKSEGGGSLTVFFSVLLALVGGPLVIWRVITAHVQAQAARHQAEAAHHQAQTAREGHYTDLFTKAVEQLGATREVKRHLEVKPSYPHINGKTEYIPSAETEPNLEVRLGAIYALERIARDSERDHGPIMEVLCAYIRNPQNCGKAVRQPDDAPVGSDEWHLWRVVVPRPRVDIQAALTVIGRRPRERIAYEVKHRLTLDLSDANLQRVNLMDGMFARANFFGAHLEDAWLRRVNFEGAQLSYAFLDEAWAGEANLQGANMNRASFAGAKCTKANFAGAILIDVNFLGTNLSEAAGLDDNNLALAKGDDSTILPVGMSRPTNWNSTTRQPATTLNS